MIYIGSNHIIHIQLKAVRIGMRRRYKTMRQFGIPIWQCRIVTMAYVLESDMNIGNITALVQEDLNGTA